MCSCQTPLLLPLKLGDRGGNSSLIATKAVEGSMVGFLVGDLVADDETEWTVSSSEVTEHLDAA